jgi:hypothetical protein
MAGNRVLREPLRLSLHDRPHPIIEEPPGQFLDLHLIGHRLANSNLREIGVQLRGLGAPGPVLHPGVNDGVVHEPLFDLIAGRKAGTPGCASVLERLRVLPVSPTSREPSIWRNLEQ